MNFVIYYYKTNTLEIKHGNPDKGEIIAWLSQRIKSTIKLTTFC